MVHYYDLLRQLDCVDIPLLQLSQITIYNIKTHRARHCHHNASSMVVNIMLEASMAQIPSNLIKQPPESQRHHLNKNHSLVHIYLYNRAKTLTNKGPLRI